MTDPVILFAGGGSGGHISPALAVAERIAEIRPSTRTFFVCSDRDVDRTMLTEAGVPFEPIPSVPFSLRPRALARFAGGFAASRRAARAMIECKQVSRVVAMGGFVAAPVVAAAAQAGTNVTLLNLDDPPGKANCWIARRSEHVLSAIELRTGFADAVVGMPVRRCAVAGEGPQACRRHLGLEPDTPTLLVTGASQGARSINELLIALAERDPDTFDGWQVLHLTGPADQPRVAAAYAAAGIRADTRSFMHGMGPVWGAADLAVSRAGASSVAEAWANGVPTVFLPYPHHRDRHQQQNARPMAAAGGARIEIDHADPQANRRGPGATVRELMRNGRLRQEMSDALRDRPAPDAAGRIARLLLR